MKITLTCYCSISAKVSLQKYLKSKMGGVLWWSKVKDSGLPQQYSGFNL